MSPRCSPPARSPTISFYGKGLTPFLRLARDAGAGPLADGVGMLVEQAAEAFAVVAPACGPQPGR